MQNQQVGIVGDDGVGSTGDGQFQEDIVAGIAASSNGFGGFQVIGAQVQQA